MATKKLIEVAMPLDKINAASAREKSIRHGHPSTLHLWWARRPLAAARAVIWSSLVDDPSSHPELFPTEEDQNRERQRLFRILEDLVIWENSNNQDVLNAAKAEIMKSTNGNAPALLDPFAGGGAIPLEAQRLGLETYAHDLNPVAVMINKAMIEIPSRFMDMPPANPNDNISSQRNTWHALNGLSSDISYYGNRLKQIAFKEIGHLFPSVELKENEKATVIAWLWARSVQCQNPTCRSQIPLMGSFVLSKKRGNEVWVTPQKTGEKTTFKINHGKYNKIIEAGTKFVNSNGKGKKGAFLCPICNSTIINSSYVDEEANKGNMSFIPVAIVAEGKNGRIYLEVKDTDIDGLEKEINRYYDAHEIDSYVPHAECRGTFASNAQGGRFGFFEFKDYFTKRQLISLVTFCKSLESLKMQIEKDAISSGYKNDHLSIVNGGSGARAYSEAISVYLCFLIDKLADLGNSLNRWEPNAQCPRQLFARQAIPIVWDFAESNPFSNSSGSWDVLLRNLLRCITADSFNYRREKEGHAKQQDAQSDSGLRKVMISTDPPYYDNICYSDLSDFFYVWMRVGLASIYPELFKTMLVPKTEELVANRYRFAGGAQEAKIFFENGMLEACKEMYCCASDDIPVSIYYAYKQNDTDKSVGQPASSGWETMLRAIIKAGFVITGTWPLETECSSRTVSQGTNALASSIVLVCRKRSDNAPSTTRRNLINALRRELRPALKKLQESNIAPVDLAQSAIGPGMGVFSCFSKVLEADGTPMNVRSALQIINEEVDLYFNEQVSDLDTMSRFCVDLYTQSAFNDIKFGEADVLARAKGTSVAALASHDIVYAKAGTVHLLERTELPEKIDENESCIWLLTQQLTQAMATGGVEACAKAVFTMFGSNAERAKDLAYRLYTIAEQKKWASEAFAYNALVVAWPDIQSRAAMMQRERPEQLDMFKMGLLDS